MVCWLVTVVAGIVGAVVLASIAIGRLVVDVAVDVGLANAIVDIELAIVDEWLCCRRKS